MSAWRFQRQSPPGWSEACARAGSLFHGAAWLNHVERSFGGSTLFGSAVGDGLHLPVSVLPAGPFRVGYASFPAGGALGSGVLNLDDLAPALREFPLDLLRVGAGALEAVEPGARTAVVTPETIVHELASWDVARLPVLLRDVKKSARSGFVLSDARDPALGPALHALYLGTLGRHGGSARYPVAYFTSLIALCGIEPRLRCLLAEHDGTLAGFCVVALHGRTGYYLHGAVNPAKRSLGVTDTLVHQAIEWSRAQGMDAFNLMTSPPDQRGLIRFKEKWGGRTTGHRTFELPLRPLRAALFRGAARVHAMATSWRGAR